MWLLHTGHHVHAASFFNAYKLKAAQGITVGVIGMPNVDKRSVININPLKSAYVTLLKLEELPLSVVDT